MPIKCGCQECGNNQNSTCSADDVEIRPRTGTRVGSAEDTQCSSYKARC